jgi:hypothetical protein
MASSKKESSVTTINVNGTTPQEIALQIKSLQEQMSALALLIDPAVDAIDREIASLRGQIEPLNARIAELQIQRKELTGKANEDRVHATRAACAECGQGRHADNDKTRNCKTYAESRKLKAVA